MRWYQWWRFLFVPLTFLIFSSASLPSSSLLWRIKFQIWGKMRGILYLTLKVIELLLKLKCFFWHEKVKQKNRNLKFWNFQFFPRVFVVSFGTLIRCESRVSHQEAKFLNFISTFFLLLLFVNRQSRPYSAHLNLVSSGGIAGARRVNVFSFLLHQFSLKVFHFNEFCISFSGFWIPWISPSWIQARKQNEISQLNSRAADLRFPLPFFTLSLTYVRCSIFGAVSSWDFWNEGMRKRPILIKP